MILLICFISLILGIIFKKKGYKFVGWNTKADGSGTYFSNKQKNKRNGNHGSDSADKKSFPHFNSKQGSCKEKTENSDVFLFKHNPILASESKAFLSFLLS